MEPPASSPSNVWQVHVSGFPAFTQPQELTRVFASYGPVRLDKLNNKFAVLSFAEESDAREALDDSNKVNIYGDVLAVKPYLGKEPPTTSKRAFVRSKKKGAIIDPRRIPLTGDFHEQLDSILDAVRLTQEEVRALSGLYVDLEWYLQLLWPGCVALPFGSITTGLGIKSSDADCFIQVPPLFRHPAANFVNKTKKLLSQYPRTFSEILAIPRANTPIVKFFHIPTEFNCDVTFKTPLGAQNSKLIAFLLHADPRLLPLAVIIKYWAKVNGFSGTGKLTNYALTMLIIFYLQQAPDPILPSVHWLQRDSSNAVIVDHWNTGFMHDHQQLPKTNNTLPISDLLGGFFKYYSTFDFAKMVVCPLTGLPMSKEIFKDPTTMPPEFERYSRNVLQHGILPLRFTTSVCVQDPIELCHNVASPISGRLAFEIKAFFKFAAEAYEKEKENNCTNFLKIILLQRPKLPRRGSPDYRVVLYPHILDCVANDDWKQVVREVMMQLFEHMCKIDLTKVEDEKGEVPKYTKEKYTGIIVKAIWKRKQFSKLYSVSQLSFIEKQLRITEEIMNVDKETFEVKFQLTLSFSKISRQLVALIKLVEGDASMFNEFGKFFISSLQGWYLSLLKPYFGPRSEESSSLANDGSPEGHSEKTDDNDVDIKVEVVTTEDPDSSCSDNLADITSDTNDAVDDDAHDTSGTKTST